MNYFLMIAAIALSAFGCTKGEERGAVWVGSVLPSFTTTDVTGVHTYSSSSRERVTVIYLFWSECGTCKEQSEEVIRLAATHPYPKISVICLARGGGEQATQELAESYWAALGSTTPMPPLHYDANRAIYSLFAKSGVPRIYIADTQGVIRSAYDDAVSYEVLNAEITKLLP